MTPWKVRADCVRAPVSPGVWRRFFQQHVQGHYFKVIAPKDVCNRSPVAVELIGSTPRLFGRLQPWRRSKSKLPF